MCCLLTLMAIAGPRVATIIWWLVDMSFFDRVFNTVFWPVVGIIFAPWTTLFYLLAWVGSPGVHGWDYVLIVIGILLDVATHGGGIWRHRKRVPGYAT
jgi:hypothetical protein